MSSFAQALKNERPRCNAAKKRLEGSCKGCSSAYLLEMSQTSRGTDRLNNHRNAKPRSRCGKDGASSRFVQKRFLQAPLDSFKPFRLNFRLAFRPPLHASEAGPEHNCGNIAITTQRTPHAVGHESSRSSRSSEGQC